MATQNAERNLRALNQTPPGEGRREALEEVLAANMFRDFWAAQEDMPVGFEPWQHPKAEDEERKHRHWR